MYKLLTKTLPRQNVRVHAPTCAVVQWRYHHPAKKEKTPPTASTDFLQRFLISAKKFQTVQKDVFVYFANLYVYMKDGTVRYKNDLLRAHSIIKRFRSERNPTFTLEEQQLRLQMLINMRRVLPVFMVLLIPGTLFFIVPVLHYWRLQLLPHQYLTPEEYDQQQLMEARARTTYAPELLYLMENDIQYCRDDMVVSRFREIVKDLRNGRHPTARKMVPLMILFDSRMGIFAPTPQKQKYLLRLSKLHGTGGPTLGIKYKFCCTRACELLSMDKQIIEEGGPTKLPLDIIKWALFFRGANPLDMSESEMQAWLTEWLNFSHEAAKAAPFAILYGPIFFAHNHWR